MDITALTSALTDLVDECRPKATASMAEFATAGRRDPGTVVASDGFSAVGDVGRAVYALHGRELRPDREQSSRQRTT